MAQPQPNAQLEAALVQFGQQSRVSPDQEAQLRAAITSDAKLLGELNQAALANQLRGFALPTAGSTAPNHVGHYDLQTGVVSLPPAAFQPSGTTASADLKAVLQVQEMTIRFGHDTYPVLTPPGATTPPAPQPVSQDMLDNLQATLNGSPALAEEVKKAATTRDTSPNASGMLLENFGFVRPDVSAGGTYDGGKHSMNLPALGLQTNTTSNPQGRFDPDDLTFVIGHEIQHGFNHPTKNQATATFLQQVRQTAASAPVVHDYTSSTRDYIRAGRNDEAKAEIAGWNALLSRQQQLNPNLTLDDMRFLPTRAGRERTQDFIELDSATNTTIPRSGLSFNSDNTLSQAPANVAAMGQHYFNRPDASAPLSQRPVHLGESGKTDYTNYYGTWAVEQITQAERQHAQSHPGVVHKLTLDMAGIGLKEALMEQEGINITINKATPQPYYDSSQTPTAPGTFHHTQDGSVNPQHNHQYVPVAPTQSNPQNGSTPAPIQSPVSAPTMTRSFSSPADADISEQQRTTGAPSSTTNPPATSQVPFSPPLMPAIDERERDKRDDKEREQQVSDPLSINGPFNDPYVNRAYAALLAGDSNELDRVSIEFSKTPEGQQMAHRGDQLLTQHQEQHRLQEQQQPQTQQAPVMRM